VFQMLAEPIRQGTPLLFQSRLQLQLAQAVPSAGLGRRITGRAPFRQRVGSGWTTPKASQLAKSLCAADFRHRQSREWLQRGLLSGS
jgi:hypothetical protein